MYKSNIKQEIIKIGQMMSARGMVGTFEGNISYLDDDAIYITPSGQSKELLTEEMIIVTDRNMNILEGKGKPSSELTMHLKAYELRPDARSVIHCHAPYCTAYAINNKAIESNAMAEINILFGGRIPLLPFGLPGTDEIIKGYENYLEYNVILLANHGMLAIGSSLIDAYSKTVTAEMMAHILFISDMMGGAKDIPEADVNRLRSMLQK
ncbi:MAG: class II aldolase/adducin family protein [Christensenellales bacterium]